MIATVVATVMALAPVASAQASSLSDWYQDNKDGGGSSVETTSSGGSLGELGESGAYDSPQVRLRLTERKLTSPLLGGAVVGKTTVPENWTITTTDLTLGSESITCPNAIWVSVKDPEGKCEFVYLSRREFEEKTLSAYGYESKSEDDAFDVSMMMHALDYREAPETCDLMAKVLFGDGLTCVYEREFTDEEKAELENVRAQWRAALTEMYEQTGMANFGQVLAWTDVTAAERTYSGSDGSAVTVAGASAGYEFDADMYGTSSKSIFWAMPAICAMRTAPGVDHSAYEEAFDAFKISTTTSKEYDKLRELNSQKLASEWIKAQNAGSTYAPTTTSYDDYESSTVDSGDTYSAIDGWDDVIRDETDYTTGDGSHVKISNDWDHVFEGDDGNIYVSSSPDGPAGSVELSPTQIGE